MNNSRIVTSPKRRSGQLARWTCTLVAIFAISAGSRYVLAQGSTLKSSDGVSLSNDVPYQVRDVTVEQKLGDSIPLDWVLTDSLGHEVTTGDFFDGKKPTIVTLNYSNCPMLCSVQLNQLTKSLAELSLQLNEDFRCLSVSIDPAETTEQARATKQKYVQQLQDSQPQAEQGWEFCTAEQAVITRLADRLGFRYTYNEQTKEFYHPAMLAFVSPQGVITRYSLAVDFPPDQVKKALVESGDGTVGTPVDQFILWCFSYDPSSNSYVPEAWKIMRVGGAFTVGVVLAFLTPYWFGRRRVPAGSASDQPPLDSTAEPPATPDRE